MKYIYVQYTRWGKVMETGFLAESMADAVLSDISNWSGVTKADLVIVDRLAPQSSPPRTLTQGRRNT